MFCEPSQFTVRKPKHAKRGSRLFWLGWLLVAAITILAPGQLQAGFITFTGSFSDSSGTGFGSIESLMGLQAPNGQTTFESGSITWNGSADVLGGDALGPPKSQTLPVSLLIDPTGVGITGNKFTIIFQVNEDGPDHALTLQKFTLNFFKADGSQAIGDVSYNGPDLVLEGVGTGHAGWIFDVTLTDAEAAAFFGTSTNRLGMTVNSDVDSRLFDVGDGPDNFFVAKFIPEPSSIILLASGAGLMGVVGLRRFRKPTTF